MNRLVSILLVALLLSQLFTITASAATGVPVGTCVSGFELHPFMEHSGDHMHHHIGVAQDLNGDGFICMNLLSADLHLHLDNTVPIN